MNRTISKMIITSIIPYRTKIFIHKLKDNENIEAAKKLLINNVDTYQRKNPIKIDPNYLRGV